MEIQEIFASVRADIELFESQHPDGVVIIRWATATWKSKLSLLLSEFFDVEIISADSRQIFRGMNIGTDKVSAEIRAKIPHHMIDIVDPNEMFTAGQRKRQVEELIPQIQARGALPVIVGGTGLYVDMIYKNFTMPEVEPDMELRKQLYETEEKQPGTLHQMLTKVDPLEAANIHPRSTRFLVRALEIYYKSWVPKSEGFRQQPVKRPLLLIGLWRDKEDTNRRINARIKEMLESGLIDEVKGILDAWFLISDPWMQGIGYKEVGQYLTGKVSKDEMVEQLKRNTHHLAKKQRTRFKRYIAEGIEKPKENVTYHVHMLSES